MVQIPSRSVYSEDSELFFFLKTTNIPRVGLDPDRLGSGVTVSTGHWDSPCSGASAQECSLRLCEWGTISGFPCTFRSSEIIVIHSHQLRHCSWIPPWPDRNSFPFSPAIPGLACFSLPVAGPLGTPLKHLLQPKPLCTTLSKPPPFTHPLHHLVHLSLSYQDGRLIVSCSGKSTPSRIDLSFLIQALQLYVFIYSCAGSSLLHKDFL